MKQLLLTTFTLLSLNAFTQTYAKVYIWNVAPDTVYRGDSVDVDFKFDPPVVSPFADSTFMQFDDGTASALPKIWIDKWSNLYNYPRSYAGTPDSTYRVRIKVPITALPGVCKIIGRGGSYSQPFYVKSQVTTGIKTHTNSDARVIETRYFNLLGEEITNPTSGQKFIKTNFYEDDSFSSKLIMML